MDKTNLLVQKTKEILKKNKRDSAHNLDHHKRVWENCQAIIKEESLKPNQELLKIAAYWHDVVVGKPKWPSKLMVDETCKYLEKVLKDNKFSDEEIKIIINSIQHHEFRDKPITQEGLILQDADKLDAISKERWKSAINEYRKGKLNKEEISSYSKTALKWLPILGATFHYHYSQKAANKLIDDIWNDKEIREIVSELGLNEEYKRSHKEMNLLSTKIKRAIIKINGFILKLRIT